MNTRETRFLRGKVESRTLTAEQEAAGYIGAITALIPYESDSREMRDAKDRPFIERLARGVFSRSLSETSQEVFADVGHNDATLFARRGANLEITETDAGLVYTALLPDTNAGRDLRTNVKHGIIIGTSFEFELRDSKAGQAVEKRSDGMLIRTIKDAILHRVNPVSTPAYLGTQLEARSVNLIDVAVEALEAPVVPAETPLDTRLMEQRVRFL